MPVDDSGLNETGATSAIENVISGGVDIHLLTTAIAFTDTSTEIVNKSDKSVSVPEADFTINTPADFTGTTTLELNTDVEYGATDIGVVQDIAILGSNDNAILANEVDTPDLTGEDYTLESGEVLYELGNA